jgi:hypothetical protein
MTAHYALLKQTLIAHLNSQDLEIDLDTQVLVDSYLNQDCLNKGYFRQFSKCLEAREYIENLFNAKDLSPSETEALAIFCKLLEGLDLKAFSLKFTRKNEIETIAIFENLISLEQILINKFPMYVTVFKKEKLRYSLPMKQIF